jgi:hypothetical protein
MISPPPCIPGTPGKVYIHFCLIIMEAYVTVPAKAGISCVAGASHIIV